MPKKEEKKLKPLRIKTSSFERFQKLTPQGEDSDAFFNKLMDSYVPEVEEEEKEVEEEFVEIPLQQPTPTPPAPAPIVKQATDLQEIKEIIQKTPRNKISFIEQWNWKLITILVGGILAVVYFVLKVVG